MCGFCDEFVEEGSGLYVMKDSSGFGIVLHYDKLYDEFYLQSVESEFDMLDIKFCPICGKKLKFVDSKNSDLAARGVDAAEKFLLRKDYDIITKDADSDTINIVAVGDNGIHFIHVYTKDENSFFDTEDIPPYMRGEYEREAMEFLKDNGDLLDLPISFDAIGLVVVSSDRALLRYHIGIFSI